MATYTTNLNLKKPAQSDKIRIADINNNMDDLDAAFGAVGTESLAAQLGAIQDGIAIVANGNVHDAITAGQFVYVKNHDTLDTGLYIASSNISANGTLSSSNLTADTGGGLNTLNAKFEQTSNNYTSSSLTLANIQANADAIAANRVGIFHVGYLNGTAAAAIGLTLGASFVFLIKHTNARAILIFLKISDGTYATNYKSDTWNSTIDYPLA